MTRRSLACLTPLALGLALAACGSRTDTTTTNTMDTSMTGTTNDTAMAPAGADNGSGAMMPAPSAQDFVDKAAKSDAFEIAAARLAATHAASADVKAFASKMIAAHTDSTAKIKKSAAAATPAITPDATLTDDQNAKLADLGKLNGADFDKAYATGQVAAHEEALALMKAYAESGEAPTLKAAAGEIAPVVSDHLTMARSLAAK